ncbi:type II toxin-antitoxin system RelE family toxin [Trabulsiella odontotermitis]|uniref:Plasmid stabilization protein n=1 Tax=Trabulsiella odontotermitis TaxID=379893 RepID=A0A0L0GLW6_9ENTR|nr:type II toxin-antitoxin system RelE/ParE family toxin [Trabulsiella odontotermitis]KNC89884.1 plasmid stabilization protein [Trabulsiella odontotermitis]KNC93080.1 plasmid stabilization protein [Trabulsiella odontotermitis]
MKFVWSRAAWKQLMRIDCRYRQRVKDRLVDIGDGNAPPPDIKRLSHPEGHFRLRVGDYRVIFEMQGELQDICYIVAVHRRTSTTYLHEECATYGCSVY